MTKTNLILVGFMGTGKSTVARALGEKTRWPVVDLDEEIETEIGCTISDIFKYRGEAEFRKMEQQVMLRILESGGQIISCGGGIVTVSANIGYLKQGGTVFCLRAHPEVIWKRVRNRDHRPLLEGEDRRAEIDRLLAERAPLYAQFEEQVDCDHRNSSEIANEILERFRALTAS